MGTNGYELVSLAQRETLSDEVAGALRERILSGTLGRGERLVEAEIARELGISRGPVREALSQLRGEGLVREEPRKGSYVVSLSAEDVADVMGVRAALEAYALRLIVERRDTEAVNALAKVAERIRTAAKEEDSTGVGALDWEFHETLCRLSRNQRLYDYYRTHAALLQSLIASADSMSQDFRPQLLPVADEHSELVDAMRKGDVEKSEMLCREHLERSRDYLLDQVLDEK